MSSQNNPQVKNKDSSQVKRKKIFQTSKPSYLITNIPSQLMKDINERLSQLNSNPKPLSPVPQSQKNALSPQIKKIQPKRLFNPPNKPITSQTRTNTISISVNKTTLQKPVTKRIKRSVCSPKKRNKSLSLNNSKSNSFNNENIINKKRLNSSNSFTVGKKANHLGKVIKTENKVNISSISTSSKNVNSVNQNKKSANISTKKNCIITSPLLRSKQKSIIHADNKFVPNTPQKTTSTLMKSGGGSKNSNKTKTMFSTAQKKNTIKTMLEKKTFQSTTKTNVIPNEKHLKNKKFKPNNSSPTIKMKPSHPRKSSDVDASKKQIFSLTDLHKSAPFQKPSTISNSKTTISSSRTRRVSKIDSCTMAGYSQPNVQKVNQDNFFIEKSIFNDPEQFFVGVCDGHGLYGHLCSDFISSNLPDYLNAEYKINTTKTPISSIIVKSFSSFNQELITEKEIDSKFSGTTCVSVLIFQDKLICANLGDSRAVLGSFEKGAYTTINLSRDHKPTETDECERIENHGGRISPYFEEETKEFIGPKRIWLKDSDIPGLAMTRSFGDQIAHCVGVIAEPEIKEYMYTGNERFVIIASDGVWEFIDSEESVHIVKDYYERDMDANGAVKALVQEAFKRWRREEDIVDDITAVVIFFE